MADNRTNLYHIIRAAGKRKENELKDNNAIRLAVIKAKIQADKEMQVHGQKQQMAANTPQQAYLRSRAMQENPLAQLSIPTEGSDSNAVTFPVDEVVQTPNGSYTSKTIPEAKKQMMFMTKYEQMKKAHEAGTGPKPSALADKIYQNYYNTANNIKNEPTGKAYKPNKATQEFLKDMSSRMQAGNIKSQDEAMRILDNQRSALRMRGADIDHIEKMIDENLPATAPKRKSSGGFMKWGSSFWKKTGGKWIQQRKNDALAKQYSGGTSKEEFDAMFKKQYEAAIKK